MSIEYDENEIPQSAQDKWERSYVQYYMHRPLSGIRNSVMHPSGYNDGYNIVIKDLTKKEIEYLKRIGFTEIEQYAIVNFST